MKIRTYQTEVVLPENLERIFEFFSNAGNLNELTPHWLHFSIRSPLPDQMKAGTRLEYGLRIHGIPVLWQTLITEWNPPFHFVDSQIKGPYKMWVHRHEFHSVPEGTRVRDTVDYAVAGGILEPWIHRFLIYPDIQRIFAYRTARLGSIFKRP